MKENGWQLMWYFLFWLVLPFMVAISFYGIFRKWRIYYKKTCYKLFTNIFFALLLSSRLNLHVYFRSNCQTPITEMLSLNRNEKVTCENCGTQITKLNFARHKKSCSAGTLYCTQCPSFSTKSQNDLNYHIAKKHSAPKPEVTFKCKLCFQEFAELYANVNIETLITECRSDQKQKMWRRKS